MNLLENGCSKLRIRVARVDRRRDHHDFGEMTLDIQIEGDFDASDPDRDHWLVVPAAAIRTMVYDAAQAPEFADPEAFGLLLGTQFLDRYRQVMRVRIDLAAESWQRHSATCFTAGGAHRRTAHVVTTRDRKMVEAGVADYALVSTRHIVSTSLTARWHYHAEDVSWTPSWHGVLQVIADTFARHDDAEQHALYAIGEAVLAECGHVGQIRLAMPRKHYLPCAAGVEIFSWSEGPHDVIEAVCSR